MTADELSNFEYYVRAHGVPAELASKTRGGYAKYRDMIDRHQITGEQFNARYLSWNSCMIGMLLSLRRTDLINHFSYDVRQDDSVGNQIWGELFRLHPNVDLFCPMPLPFPGPFQTILYRRVPGGGLAPTHTRDPSAVYQDLDPRLVLACTKADPCRLKHR